MFRLEELLPVIKMHSESEMPVDGAISLFSQYGLSGAVIGALFYVVMMFIRELRVINETHNDRHDKRNELHAGERREWLGMSKDILATLHENTALIRTLSIQLNNIKPISKPPEMNQRATDK
jgi:hypothetical protein